jgi:2,4-dienoyl-CoA reductase (NADPH2)
MPSVRKGGGLIVTGGFSPNLRGRLHPFSAEFSKPKHANAHKVVTDAVHEHGGKIALQLLHAGRYAMHPFSQSASGIRAPIAKFAPSEMSHRQILKTIDVFANSASIAKQAGYDGVEVMGSEGYLLNQFICKRTNMHYDEWGGTYENRMRFPLEVVRAIREKVGEEFIIIFRLSMRDLVEEGSTFEEVIMLAKELEKAGVSIINTGIGWHEARIPTIATQVPRSAFAWVTEKVKPHINVPVITCNRINTPDEGEKIIASGQADMVSMARPFLADSDFVNKAAANQMINTCIGCNQACKLSSESKSMLRIRNRGATCDQEKEKENCRRWSGSCGFVICDYGIRTGSSCLPVRKKRSHWRSVPSGHANPRKRGISRNHTLLC